MKKTTGKLSYFRDTWHLVKPYWTSVEKNKALFWLIMILLINLFEVYMAVQLNNWNGTFYNTLQNYDKVGFMHALYLGLIIIVIYVTLQIIGYYFSFILEIRWRKWMTNNYLTLYFQNKLFYKIRFIDSNQDNPDQRISEDIPQFIALTIQLFMGAFKAATTLISFIFILWRLSGNFKFLILDHQFYIPGFMVWIALLCAFVSTYVTFKIGNPLIKLSFTHQVYEADFRYNLVRVREYAEHIASYKGEIIEKSILTKDFENIQENFMHTLYRNLKINIFNFTYLQISSIIPSIISAGRFFSREITLGNMMQINSAFGQVNFSFSYLVFAYNNIANCRAAMNRLLGFQRMLHDAEMLPENNFYLHNKYMLSVENLKLKLPSGKILFDNFAVNLIPGDRLLIQGPSGFGKSTLLKALNGMWPFTEGIIYKNPHLNYLFIAQKPYLPKTTLKGTICYPKTNDLPNDYELAQILEKCGLNYLKDKLNESNDWNNKLSLGEQQKIAFCRIIINKPDVIFMDEITSALDENSELELSKIICDLFPKSIIISVGHRPSLVDLHNMTINLAAI